MTQSDAAGGSSKGMIWGGRVMSAIPVALLLFSGIGKVMKPEPVLEGFAEMGFPESTIVAIGIAELACTVVYLIPQTAVLGAILLTGYLGGATATHVRIEDPLFFPPIIFGVLVWGGLFLRDARVRALIPMRKSA